jgi:TolB-like protein/DNA-binding winged helix-turn-helix (wHTH) protein/Flp pilus assembly protein TadD
VTNPERKPARVRVGAWVADPATNELCDGTRTVRLEPKPMDVLMRLAACPGEAVSREELLAQVWPGMVVGDEALTQSVARLRRALGEGSQDYIETLSKRGYRLTVPVQPADDASHASPARRARGIAWAAAGLVVALIGTGWYVVTEERPGSPAAVAEPLARNEPATVTIAPFEALSNNPDEAYFARGVSDTLMTELGRLSGLRVTTSGGRYAVSGSVQRSDDVLRVNVRLVDARTGEQVWSERFERPYADLFEVQDQLTQRLAEALPARMSEAERRRLAKRHTRNLEAYDRFLQAQALFLVRQPAENAQARELYRKAIAIDPSFARAYAGLAMTHAIEPRLGGPADARSSIDRAMEIAESARLIDPDLAEVHWALGFIHAQARRHPEAIAALQRAVEINPSFADAYALMGGVHTYLGQPAKSIPLLRTAMRLDPAAGYLYYLLLGRAYLFQGDVEQALINLREAVARNPADVETHVFLAAALVQGGNLRAAQWEVEEIRTLQPGFSLATWLAEYPLASEALRQRLRALLSQAGL